MQIFITRGEDSSGPYTLEQVQDYLAQGVLLPDDLAYHEGLEGWIPLSQLMASIAAPVDPAPPQPVATTPEPVQSGPITESAPVKAGDKKKLLIGVGVGVAVLAIAAAVWFFVIWEKDSGTGNQQVAQQPQPKPTKNAPSPVDPGPDKPAKKPDNVLWEFETVGRVKSSPTIGPDGTVYFGSYDNKLYAIKTDSKGPANSPWPMRGQNAQHTGRAVGATPAKLNPELPTIPSPPLTNSEPTKPEPQSGSLGENIKGKRIVCQAPGNKEMLLQFEKDGTYFLATIVDGRVAVEEDDMTYRVDGLDVRLRHTQNGNEVVGVAFASNNPKRGDKILVGASLAHVWIILKIEPVGNLKIEPTPPLANTPTKQSKIGLGQVLSVLKQPLTDQEKLFVGRWKEISVDDPENLAFTIVRSDRSYTYFTASPTFDEDGNEIAGKIEPTLSHGVWKIEDKRIYFLDLMLDGEKSEEPVFINELHSLTKAGYLFYTANGDVANTTRGLSVEKFTAPEMLPYNDAADLHSFDIRKAYNSAKGKGTEQINKSFSSTPEPEKPINPKSAGDSTKP